MRRRNLDEKLPLAALRRYWLSCNLSVVLNILRLCYTLQLLVQYSESMMNFGGYVKYCIHVLYFYIVISVIEVFHYG